MKKFMTNLLTAMLVLVLLVSPAAAFAEEGVTYEYGADILVGTNTYEVCALDYTVYTFRPDEIGKYTISTDNSKLGIASYNGMWVMTEPSGETVTETQLQWDCSSVGQGILIAAASTSGGVKITISRQDIVINTYETIHYENKVVPAPFTFESDASALEYVDVEDGVKDVAVFGVDGFYHLNDANGPRLYICLDDTMMSFFDMREPGQLLALVRNPDNSIKYRVDYNVAFDAYWECVDSATKLYPVTDDLIVMVKNIGDFHGWYEEDGWLNFIDKEDGWMFACQYIPGETFENNELDDGEIKNDENIGGIIADGGDGGVSESGNGNTATGNTGAANNGATNSNAHQTGDSSYVLIAVGVVAVIGIAAVALLIRRKRNTVSF